MKYQSIQEGIKKSAIIICLTSPGYFNKDSYCSKELDLFYKKAQLEKKGLKVGDRSRILNVLLNNYSFTEWPSELSGTTGFPFHDAKEPDDFGDPIDTGSPDFRIQLQNLRDAIVKLINDFKKEVKTESNLLDPKEEEEKNRFTIYIGEVADTLRATRKRTIMELENKGFKVVTVFPRLMKLSLMIRRLRKS